MHWSFPRKAPHEDCEIAGPLSGSPGKEHGICDPPAPDSLVEVTCRVTAGLPHPLLAKEMPGETTWHHDLDHLGTPRLVTDEDGSTVASKAYLPLGYDVSPGLGLGEGAMPSTSPDTRLGRARALRAAPTTSTTCMRAQQPLAGILLGLALASVLNVIPRPASGLPSAAEDLFSVLRTCLRVDSLVWTASWGGSAAPGAAFWCSKDLDDDAGSLVIWSADRQAVCTGDYPWPYARNRLEVGEVVDVPLDWFLDYETAENLAKASYTGPVLQAVGADGQIDTLLCHDGHLAFLHGEAPP